MKINLGSCHCFHKQRGLFQVNSLGPIQYSGPQSGKSWSPTKPYTPTLFPLPRCSCLWLALLPRLPTCCLCLCTWAPVPGVLWPPNPIAGLPELCPVVITKEPGWLGCFSDGGEWLCGSSQALTCLSSETETPWWCVLFICGAGSCALSSSCIFFFLIPNSFLKYVFKGTFSPNNKGLFWYFLFYSILLGGYVYAQISGWSTFFGKYIGVL